jgi:hypothetical protein
VIKQIRLTLALAFSNLLLSAHYLFVGYRLSPMYSQFSVEVPNPMLNKYFLGFLALSILSFIFWGYLKTKLNKGLEGNKKLYNIVLLFLMAPIIYLALTEVLSLIVIYIIVPLTT